MATQSILKTVRIADKNAARRLISAMENAKKWNAKHVDNTKAHRKLKGNEIKEVFGDR